MRNNYVYVILINILLYYSNQQKVQQNECYFSPFDISNVDQSAGPTSKLLARPIPVHHSYNYNVKLSNIGGTEIAKRVCNMAGFCLKFNDRL